MAALQTIKDAQALYEQEQFGECIEICKQLMHNDDDSFEAYLLLAKCGIMVTAAGDAETEALTVVLANSAYKKATTINEFFRVKEELRDALDEKEITITKKYFEYFKNNPQSLSEFFSLWQKWIRFRATMIIQVEAANNETGKSLANKDGFETEKDAYSQYSEKRPKINTDSIIAKNAFETSWSVFSQLQTRFEENKDASANFLVGGFVRDTSISMAACESLMEFFSTKGVEDSVKLVRLKKLAEMRDYMLRAECYPNGGAPLSLMQASRERTLQDLSKTYEEIEKLDPEYERPELPSAAVKQPFKNTNTTSGSGGCYVATAVYGSYDCPQVWTLRRYRDYALAKTWYGRLFIHAYYAISPKAVRLFGSTKWFNRLWKGILDRKIYELNKAGYLNTPYKDIEW